MDEVAPGLRLGRIQGIEVRVHVSWLLIAGLLTWSFWNRFDEGPRFDRPTALAMAVAGAVLLLGSILAHELGHALEAKYRGIPVSGITLFLFGGVTEMEGEAHRPADEFAVTAVGPFTSAATGAVFGLIGTAADRAGLAEVAAVCGLVGWLNLTLAVFNLLPGSPLDGGRIVRALAWKVTGDRTKAILIAGWCGRILGGLLIALGLLQVFFVSSAFVNGLWTAFIGWFLSGAAAAEIAEARQPTSPGATPVAEPALKASGRR